MKLRWQLLNVFRREFWIYLGLEVLIVFVMAMNDIRRLKPESILDSLNVAACLALVLSLCLRMPSRLNRMPFPVSVRQRAMLPVLAYVVLWGSGIAAILVAALFFGFSPFDWDVLVVRMLQRIPFYLLAFLMVYRLMQVTPHLMAVVVWAGLLSRMMMDFDDTFWGSWHFFLALPVALALIVFYLAEIPRELAGQDRLLIAQGPNQPVAWMRDLNITSRRTWMTGIGSLIDAILCFVVFLAFWFYILGSFGASPIRVQTYISKPWLCWLPLSAILLGTVMFREAYGRAVASGFGPCSSVGMGLMRLTIILNPLTQALGVKKGVVARCDQCRTARFIWALRCPHCGFAGPGTILNKQVARLARGEAVGGTMRQKIFFRLFMPLQLLLVFGLSGGIGSRPFEAHTVLLKFPDAKIAAQAALHIEDWVEAHVETGRWLTSNEVTLQIPKKYRLQVVYSPDNDYMTAEAYGLRWDSEAQLPVILAERLGESLPEAAVFTISPMKSRDASCLFWQTRTYLDNKIHWVQREKFSPRKSRRTVPTPPLEKPVRNLPALPPKRVK